MIRNAISITKKKVRIFLVFASLESFRYCFLRISEWSLDDAALPEFCRPLFLPYYLAMLTGILFALWAAKRLELTLGYIKTGRRFRST